MSCSKTLVETDPITGNPPQPIASATDSLCGISAIRQVSGSTFYNQWIYNRNSSQLFSSIQYADAVSQTIPFIQNPVYKGDTIVLDSTSWIIRDLQTGFVQQYFIREKKSSTLYDNIYYTYHYNSNGFLKQKYTFYNQKLTPDYVTYYYYDEKNLINCQLFTGDEKKRLLQSKISYDLTKEIKPWIYLFTDAFHEYPYLPILNFGKHPQNPVSEIQTMIYDVTNDSSKDQWITKFSGYVFSTEKYVVQVTTTGTPQQGLGFLLGTQRFDYHCWH